MRKILAGRVYRHFKGKDYKVLVVAQHTEKQVSSALFIRLCMMILLIMCGLTRCLLLRWIVKSIPRWSSNIVLS